MVRKFAAGIAAFMFLGALSHASLPAVAAPKPLPIPAHKSPAASIKGAFESVFSIVEAFRNCQENLEVDRPCLSTDGNNIREALHLLGEIQSQMTANQNELLARFDEVDTHFNQARVEGYLRELRSLGSNTSKAVNAWNEYLGCMQAKSNGQPTCNEFRGGNTLAVVPVADGLMANEDIFLYYTENLPQDVGSAVEVYAGDRGASTYRLSDALWMLNRQKLFVDAKVSSAAFRNSRYTPFATPELTDSVNGYLAFYTGLFTTYGSVLRQRVEILLADARERKDAAAVRRYETKLRAIKYDIERRIESTRDDSVAGMELTYGLTALDPSEIMMANRPGREGVTIFGGDSSLPGDRPMRSTDVEELGQGLKNFGSATALAKAQPEAFPQDGWYEVHVPVQKFNCVRRIPKPQIVSFLATNTQLPVDKVGEPQDAVSRMKVLDARPSTKDAVSTGVYCLGFGKSGNDYLKIDARKAMEANTPWPATYQWDLDFEYDEKMFAPNPYGFGVFVKTPEVPSSRIVSEQGGNRMVRWPDGFTPVMPASY